MNIKPNTAFRSRLDYREGYLDGATGKKNKSHNYRFKDCYLIGFKEGAELLRRQQSRNAQAGGQR